MFKALPVKLYKTKQQRLHTYVTIRFCPQFFMFPVLIRWYWHSIFNLVWISMKYGIGTRKGLEAVRDSFRPVRTSTMFTLIRPKLSGAQSNIIIHLECVCLIFTLFLLCFWSPPTPEGSIWLSYCCMPCWCEGERGSCSQTAKQWAETHYIIKLREAADWLQACSPSHVTKS